MRFWPTLALLWLIFIAGWASAQTPSQQPPDPATLQRFLVEMQRARDERANEVIMERAEKARLTDEVAKLKAQLEKAAKPEPKD